MGWRLSAGQGSDLWAMQTGKEMEAVSRLAPLDNSRCLYAPAAKKTTGEDGGKTLAACYHSAVDVQLLCLSICVCRGRPGQTNRKCWCIHVNSCLCKN